jgi:hypothetical protein
MSARNLLVSLVLTLVAQPTLADKCTSLQQALEAAPNNMSALKAGSTSDATSPDFFSLKWRWDASKDCALLYDSLKQVVYCSSPAPDGPTAFADAKQVMRDVEACLDKSGFEYQISAWGHHVADKDGITESGAFRVVALHVQIDVTANVDTKNKGTSSISISHGGRW